LTYVTLLNTTDSTHGQHVHTVNHTIVCSRSELINDFQNSGFPHENSFLILKKQARAHSFTFIVSVRVTDMLVRSSCLPFDFFVFVHNNYVMLVSARMIRILQCLSTVIEKALFLLRKNFSAITVNVTSNWLEMPH